MGDQVIAPTASVCEFPESVNKGTGVRASVKFRLEHRLPRRLRFAKVYLEAGPATVFFSLDGTSADWRASIGRGRKGGAQLTDREYSRLRASVPAAEMLEDDGRMLVIRNSQGHEESWLKPRWTLTRLDTRKKDRDGSG